MPIDLQPTHLENELVKLVPLKEEDFERLYKVASDPLVWEQHPNKNRYQREVFQNYFKGAIESGGAFLILDKKTGEVIGSSRLYDHKPADKEIEIGYTFISRDHWGGAYNRAVKKLMLDHAFTFADRVIFHIGAQNVRSQKALEKLGGKKTGEIEMEYFGEPKRLNFIYHIHKTDWAAQPATMPGQ